MIYPFQTNITLLAWAFGRKSAPFELVTGTTIKQIPSSGLAAYDYALLKAYPGNNEKLQEDIKTSIHYLPADDPDNKGTLNATAGESLKMAALAASGTDIGIIKEQIKKIKVPPLHFVSHLKFLAAWMYYAAALERRKTNASRFLNLPLFLSWGLYRTVDAIQFVGAMIISPIAFTLTLGLKTGLATVRLAGAGLYHGFAEGFNWCARMVMNDKPNMSTRQNEIEHLKKPLTKEQKRAKAMMEKHPEWFAKAAARSQHEEVLDTSPPEETWKDFIQQCNKALKDSLTCFSPVTDKIKPILNPMIEKSSQSNAWKVATMFTMLTMLAAVAFLDYVAAQVLIRGAENRPFDTEFFNQIGGGYAEVAWKGLSAAGETIAMGATLSAKAIAHALSPSWDKMQIGMEFFGHMLIKNALFFEIAAIGCAMVGALYVAKKWSAKDVSGPLVVKHVAPAMTAVGTGPGMNLSSTPPSPSLLLLSKSTAANNNNRNKNNTIN